MKVVYVLTGTSNNHYSLMTRISIATLRISNPDFIVVLASEKESIEYMRSLKNPLLDEVDMIIDVETPMGSAVFKSRFIKTRLGLEIDEAFVFIDSDTVIRKKIDINLYNDIGLVRNHSRYAFSEQLWKGDMDLIDKMNWKKPIEIYFNSGVIFYKGNERSRDFAEAWHNTWKIGFEQTNIHVDQPSLSHVISSDEFNIQILDNIYNAQVKSRINFNFDLLNKSSIREIEEDAVIWHYFYSDTERHNFTQFEILVKKFYDKNIYNKNQIIKLIEANNPWRNSFLLDKFIAEKASNVPKIKGFYLLWLEGRRIKAIKFWLGNFFLKILFK